MAEVVAPAKKAKAKKVKKAVKKPEPSSSEESEIEEEEEKPKKKKKTEQEKKEKAERKAKRAATRVRKAAKAEMAKKKAVESKAEKTDKSQVEAGKKRKRDAVAVDAVDAADDDEEGKESKEKKAKAKADEEGVLLDPMCNKLIDALTSELISHKNIAIKVIGSPHPSFINPPLYLMLKQNLVVREALGANNSKPHWKLTELGQQYKEKRAKLAPTQTAATTVAPTPTLLPASVIAIMSCHWLLILSLLLTNKIIFRTTF